MATISAEGKTNAAGQHDFAIPSSHADYIREYVKKLPPDCQKSGRLWRKWDVKKGAFVRNIVGKNSYAAVPKIIADELKLPEPAKYTGAALRRTSASIISESGVSQQNLQRWGRWKSPRVAEGYIAKSVNLKKRLASTMLSQIDDTAKENSSALGNLPALVPDVEPHSAPASKSTIPSGLHLHNCNNVTFTFS